MMLAQWRGAWGAVNARVDRFQLGHADPFLLFQVPRGALFSITLSSLKGDVLFYHTGSHLHGLSTSAAAFESVAY